MDGLDNDLRRVIRGCNASWFGRWAAFLGVSIILFCWALIYLTFNPMLIFTGVGIMYLSLPPIAKVLHAEGKE